MQKRMITTGGWFKRHKVSIWLSFIVILSVWLRFYNLQNRAWWFDDTARDVLAGYHIAKYHELPLIGQTSSFFPTQFYYPPQYYYLVGLVSFFARTPMQVIGTFVLIESFLPAAIFLCGLFMGDFISAAGASLLVAVSSHMIDLSNLWSPHVALATFFIGLSIALWGRKRSSLTMSFVGQGIITFSTIIDYSLVVPAIVFLVVFVIQERSNQRRLIMIVSQCCFLLLLLLPLITTLGLGSVINIVVPQHVMSLNQPHIAPYFQTVIRIWVDAFDNYIRNALIGAIVCAILFVWNYKEFWHICKKEPWIIILLIGMPIVGSLFIINPQPYVYGVLFPLFIVLLSCCVFGGHTQKTKLVIGGILFISLVYLTTNNFRVLAQEQPSDLKKAEVITDILVNDAKARGIFNSFFIYAGGVGTAPGDYGWNSRAYWYFIESKYHRRIVHFVRSGDNLGADVSQYPNVYLICSNNSSGRMLLCVKSFISSHPEYTQKVFEKYVYDSEFQISLYTRLPTSYLPISK